MMDQDQFDRIAVGDIVILSSVSAEREYFARRNMREGDRYTVVKVNRGWSGTSEHNTSVTVQIDYDTKRVCLYPSEVTYVQPYTVDQWSID